MEEIAMNRNASNLSFCDVTRADQNLLESLLLRAEPAERREVVRNSIDELLDACNQGNFVGRIATEDGRPIAAMLARLLGGRAAVIVGVGSQNAPPSPDVALLWQEMRRILAERQIRFAQWMRGEEQDPTFPLFCEFKTLATLDYLAAAPEAILQALSEGGPRTRPIRAKSLRFLNVHETGEILFRDLVEHTYRDSLDCPEFFQYRTTAEVLESYRLAPGYRPEDWMLLCVDEKIEPEGCLVLTRYEPSSILELTYMGLVPAARGKGLGVALLGQAAKRAIESGMQQVVLAVDRKNHPALQVYQGVGMERIFSETAWVRHL